MHTILLGAFAWSFQHGEGCLGFGVEVLSLARWFWDGGAGLHRLRHLPVGLGDLSAPGTCSASMRSSGACVRALKRRALGRQRFTSSTSACSCRPGGSECPGHKSSVGAFFGCLLLTSGAGLWDGSARPLQLRRAPAPAGLEDRSAPGTSPSSMRSSGVCLWPPSPSLMNHKRFVGPPTCCFFPFWLTYALSACVRRVL